MSQPTFTDPDLTTFCGLDTLGLNAVGQHVAEGKAIIQCRVTEPDPWCRSCGCQGRVHDTVVTPLHHVPLGNRPTVLHVKRRRYRCEGCRSVWRERIDKAAAPRAVLSRAALRWALVALIKDRRSIASLARALGVVWNTANSAILAEGQRVLLDDPTRLDGVAVLGIDEHCWRHTKKGDKYVTVFIDLTPVRDGTGPARLLDMVSGKNKAVVTDWLEARSQQWRDAVEVVAMDGFTGFKSASEDKLPQATEVMDPFHVVALMGEAMDVTRRETQRRILGRRGRKGDPLYSARRTLRVGADMLTEKQQTSLAKLFADDKHTPVEVTWSVYQDVVLAYRDENRKTGKQSLTQTIRKIGGSLPAGLEELGRVGRTFNKRIDDILAYFDHPRTSNGPTEAINGRLENLRGNALGFRNLTHYIARCLLDAGGFRHKTHPQL